MNDARQKRFRSGCTHCRLKNKWVCAVTRHGRLPSYRTTQSHQQSSSLPSIYGIEKFGKSKSKGVCFAGSLLHAVQVELQSCLPASVWQIRPCCNFPPDEWQRIQRESPTEVERWTDQSGGLGEVDRKMYVPMYICIREREDCIIFKHVHLILRLNVRHFLLGVVSRSCVAFVRCWN